jgi:acetolactate synthase regulatory subunit
MLKKTEVRVNPAPVWLTRLLAVLATASITTTPVLAEDAKNAKMSEIERTIAVQRATQVLILAMPAVTAPTASSAAPKGKEANWIPTGEDFFLMFRLYGPEETAFKKTWRLGEIEKVK